VRLSRRCVEKRQQQGFAIATVLVCGTLLGICALAPVSVHADTTVIPVAAVSGRYDTNIYRAPASRLPPGTDTSDFASIVSGGVQVLHKSREVDANLTAGADFNAYASNPNLNFYTTRVAGTAILDGWVDQWARGAKLRVNERFRYTPESPAFFTGSSAEDISDPFLRGIQGFRANTFANTVSAEGSYPVSRTLALEGRYSFSALRVGSVLGATSTGDTIFFDTNRHNLSAGPRVHLTPIDSISLSYSQSLISQQRTAGNTGAFETGTLTLSTDYARVMPDWALEIGGGVTYVAPAGRTYPTGGIKFRTTPERVTTVQLELSRVPAPSFFLVGGALISNLGRVQIIHRLSERLSLRGSAFYAFNEAVSDRAVKFNNLTLSTGLSYNLTRSMAVDLSYEHTDFKRETTTTGFTVLRDVVTLSLTAQWQ
jgi:opacity protein-like surface antigen